MPVEYSALPMDCRDLLLRLLEFSPERRIRSIFALQRIAFFMGFKFDDAKKKKVHFMRNFILFKLYIFNSIIQVNMQFYFVYLIILD